MRENRVRRRLKMGQPTLGCFLGLGSPSVAELLASAGMDWLIIETEHNAVDASDVERMLRAIDAAGTGTVPIVRVPSQDPVPIQKALDIGAQGVLVPMIKTAEEARAVVAATRYPPEGSRGFGPLRGSRYTFDSRDYFDRANENMLVGFVLETREAVDNLEEVCSVDGVDLLYLGFADLSLSLGLTPFKLPDPQIDAVVERVLDVAPRHGVAVGNGSTTPDGLGAVLAAGYTFVGFGPDYYLLAEAASAARAVVPRD